MEPSYRCRVDFRCRGPSVSAPGVTFEAARNLVATACLALDAEDFCGFLDCCSGDLHYVIRVQSPELRREMTWLEHDFAGMQALLEGVPEHLRRRGRLLRHLGASVLVEASVQRTVLDTSVLLLHTNLEGVTRIWAAGRYRDAVAAGPDGARLQSRVVQLHTRDLGTGSHVPI